MFYPKETTKNFESLNFQKFFNWTFLVWTSLENWRSKKAERCSKFFSASSLFLESSFPCGHFCRFFFLGSLAEIIVVVCRNVARMAAVIFMIKCLKLWRFKLQKIRLFLIVTISTWVVFPWLLSWDHRCRLQKRGSNDSSYLHDKVLKIVTF